MTRYLITTHYPTRKPLTTIAHGATVNEALKKLVDWIKLDDAVGVEVRADGTTVGGEK